MQKKETIWQRWRERERGGEASWQVWRVAVLVHGGQCIVYLNNPGSYRILDDPWRDHGHRIPASAVMKQQGLWGGVEEVKSMARINGTLMWWRALREGRVPRRSLWLRSRCEAEPSANRDELHQKREVTVLWTERASPPALRLGGFLFLMQMVSNFLTVRFDKSF